MRKSSVSCAFGGAVGYCYVLHNSSLARSGRLSLLGSNRFDLAQMVQIVTGHDFDQEFGRSSHRVADD